MKLKEFDKYKEFNNGDIKDFRNFINDCWSNRYSLYDDSNLYTNENTIKEQQFLTFDGNLIKARNYVGFISYKGEDITIYPKVFEEKIEDEYLDKYLMTNLIYWLKRSTKVKLPVIDTDIDFKNTDSFIEIMIAIFSKYTSEIIYNKPYNNYEEVEEELKYLKGRLNTSEYINKNLGTGRWNEFNVIYEPFKYNNKFNQIIKYVSTMLLKVTSNKDNIAKLNKIKFILDEVEDVSCNEYSCNEVKLNRLEQDYDIVLRFCEMFLKNTSLSKSNENRKLNFCFLIPMEILFEDFILNFIKEKFSDDFKEIIGQKSNLFLADVYLGTECSGRAFNLKQDIFMKDKNDNIYILDTKYKIIDENQNNKFGISQSDMYQMSSYALRGGYKKLALLYPKVKEVNKDIKYVVRSGFANEAIEISVILLNFILDYNDYSERKIDGDIYMNNDAKLYYDIERYLRI